MKTLLIADISSERLMDRFIKIKESVRKMKYSDYWEMNLTFCMRNEKLGIAIIGVVIKPQINLNVLRGKRVDYCDFRAVYRELVNMNASLMREEMMITSNEDEVLIEITKLGIDLGLK